MVNEKIVCVLVGFGAGALVIGFIALLVSSNLHSELKQKDADLNNCQISKENAVTDLIAAYESKLEICTDDAKQNEWRANEALIGATNADKETIIMRQLYFNANIDAASYKQSWEQVQQSYSICQSTLNEINYKRGEANAMNATCGNLMAKKCTRFYNSAEYGFYLANGKGVPVCETTDLCENKVGAIYSPYDKMIFCNGNCSAYLAHEFCHARQDFENRKSDEMECN
ncbi:Uncharacterised protein [Candidatus Anstonella stagnisolia]|nr:Uncharacterised protein [Candidatus Anstonella stagnisolia]